MKASREPKISIPHAESEAKGLALPAQDVIEDAASQAFQGLAESVDERRVPIVLGLCIMVCAGLAYLSGAMGSMSWHAQKSEGFEAKARLLAGSGLASANAGIASDP